MLFLDDLDYGLIVSTLKIREVRFDRENKEIHAECGAKLPGLSRLALQESADGFAGLEGIPGTIGGAVFMNAGAYGDSIHLILKAVDVVTADGEILRMESHQLGFSYRNSVFRDGRCPHFVVRAIFHLRPGDQARIGRKMEVVHSKRHKYNEYSYPNLGSVFSGSVYRALAKRDRYYWAVSSLFYVFNYRFKILRRESPLNRKWLNDFTLKRFQLKFEKQPFSDKTMNTIINNGQGTRVYLDYLDAIKELVDGEIPIENEIVELF
jgi:UDP-N-acetylmuramate dehydrogenase